MEDDIRPLINVQAFMLISPRLAGAVLYTFVTLLTSGNRMEGGPQHGWTDFSSMSI